MTKINWRDLKFLSQLKNAVYLIRRRLLEFESSEKIESGRLYDIELTNSCNTWCIFCPRDKTPKQGYMDFHSFKKAVQRAEEFEKNPSIHLCGLGEPLLHPNVVNFVSYLTDKGLFSNITTNAYLLTKELSKKLINAGLKEVTVSASGIDELYEKIHHLSFEEVKNNLSNFLKISKGKCRIKLSITICKPNKNEIDRIVSFWKQAGINDFIFYNTINRGGALDMGYSFVNNERYYHEAEAILAVNKLPTLCMLPFISTFIGWDGNYYMCCNDFSKKYPLGNVFQYGIKEIDLIKKNRFLDDLDICKNCDGNIINMIREILFRIENKTATQLELKQKLKELRAPWNTAK